MWKRKNHVCNRVPKLNLRSKATAKRDLWASFWFLSIGKETETAKGHISLTFTIWLKIFRSSSILYLSFKSAVEERQLNSLFITSFNCIAYEL
jgi:hypothetical protein